MFEIVVAIHAFSSRANAARHSAFRWTALRLGSRASGNRVEDLRNAFNRHRSFEITGRSRHAIWVFPRRLPLRKRAAPRVDQSDSPRCCAERPGRDSDWLPVLFRGLCPQRKSLHAVLHGSDRPFSETDRLSVSLAKCACSLESSIRPRLRRRYCSNAARLSPIVLSPAPRAMSITISTSVAVFGDDESKYVIRRGSARSR